jgi:hypothetical protein
MTKQNMTTTTGQDRTGQDRKLHNTERDMTKQNDRTGKNRKWYDAGI